MSETKPTAEGLRAAEAVWRRLKSAMDSFPNNNVHTVEMGVIIDRETNLAELLADSKKLREPATCNAGHKSNLPLALWDCPVCTQLLRDSIQEAKQVTQEVLRLHHGNPEPCGCFHCRKAREVESALGGKAE